MNKTCVASHPRAALAGLLLIGSLACAQASIACPLGNAAGNPAVDQQHVFCGEVSDNKAKGMHSRPGGVMPATAAVRTVAPLTSTSVSPTMPAGIYRLNSFDITQGTLTRTKTLSTMFPDHCDQDAVVAAIQHAFNNGTLQGDTQFIGPSGPTCLAGQPAKEFNITGYLEAKGSNVVRTAYPAY